jgi:hypothetical protein
MAKKAKKRGKARFKSRRRGKASDRSRKEKSEVRNVISFIKLEFALNLIASLIVLISGIIYMFVPMNFPAVISVDKIFIFEILNIIIGLGMFIATMTLKTSPRAASVFILVFSILALVFPPYGLVIGPIIGLIASIMVLAKLRKR